ncbi:MAG: hypothetical protein HY244_12865 [Rhizobiales bacterium]|nr:hypothetical protein [Hyphomicrobiales bacterium]
MTARTAAFIVGGLDALGWLLVCVGTFFSQSDPATKGLDTFAGLAVSIVFLLTGVPALVLAWRNRAPRLALVLSLGFPTGFVLLFAVAVAVFA